MIYNRIRLRHLHCLLAIAEHRSVGVAARALAITQPALSKTLRELEETLSVHLFERGRRGATLTCFGEIFLQHAAGSIASLRYGVDRIDVARTSSEHAVTIGALPNVAARLMSGAVRLFKQEAAGILVRVVSGGNSRLLDQLRLDELELVVGRLAKSEHMTGLSFDLLYSESLSIVARRKHPFAAIRRFATARLAEYPWILPDQGTIIQEEVRRFLLAEGVSISNNIVESTSVPFGRAYVDSSDAVWVSPRGVIQPDVDSGHLIALPVPAGAMKGPVGITTRVGTVPTPAGQLLIHAVRRAARALEGTVAE